MTAKHYISAVLLVIVLAAFTVLLLTAAPREPDPTPPTPAASQ